VGANPAVWQGGKKGGRSKRREKRAQHPSFSSILSRIVAKPRSVSKEGGDPPLFCSKDTSGQKRDPDNYPHLFCEIEIKTKFGGSYELELGSTNKGPILRVESHLQRGLPQTERGENMQKLSRSPPKQNDLAPASELWLGRNVF